MARIDPPKGYYRKNEMKRNYNRLSCQGIDCDDMEFVSMFGLDPDLAYTPAINDAMLKEVARRNMQSFERDNYSPKEAIAETKRATNIVRAELSKLI